MKLRKIKKNIKKIDDEEIEMKNTISSLESNFLNKNNAMDIDSI